MSDADDGRAPADGPEDDAVVLPIEDALDLHAFRPSDVRSVVSSYLESALEAGFREVRIIHGRGIGMQRESVRALLTQLRHVDGFWDAPPERGGWGATIVRLRPAAQNGKESAPGAV